MKITKSILSLILAVVIAASCAVTVFADTGAEEPSSLPLADEVMLDNATDSAELPTRAELSDVYGQVNNENAEVIDSLISDEAKREFSAELDRISDFEPVEEKDVSNVLGRVGNFVSSGGLSSYINNGNLLMGSEIGLSANKRDKVKILGANTNASGWVFVVDKDAMSWFVKDTDGMGIPHALVTVSYIDESNERITKSIVATDGETPGIAVFDELPDSFCGIVDIQAEGYRAASILDKEMGSGEHYTIVLEDAKENDLYIRGVDLAGKDMLNEETKLMLMDMDTGDLSLKVMVSKTGDAELPSSIEICSDNRGKTVLEMSQTSDYPFDSNTKVFTATKRWVEQSAGLLKENDLVSVKVGGESFGLEHVTVENAAAKPGTGETEVPVTTKKMEGNVSDRMGGAGVLNQTLQVLKVPVSFGVFPDGSIIFMASYDITQLDPNTQYKFSSLFEKSWNPKAFSNIKKPLEVFQKSFWENTEKVKAGKKILDSTKKVKCVSNKNYDFSMSFSLYLRTCYNKETDDHYGSGGFMFSAGLTAGITEYFLIPAGPVIVPVYVGFEGHLYIKTSISVNFCMEEPPEGEAGDPKWKYAANDGYDVSARIEVLAGFSVFGGVGVKGVLGASATGYVDFDIATVLAKGEANAFTSDPHSFIDVLYGLRIEYYLLFYSGTIKLDCLNGAKRLCDSEGEHDLTAGAFEEMEFTELSLENCAENYTPQIGAPGEPRDQYFLLNTESGLLEGEPGIISVDSSTYPDTQIQFAATRDYTALFRIASNGQRTDIYYQLQNRETGRLYSGIYKVRLPEGDDRSVSEYVVVPNKTDRNDPDSCNKVYIGAILVDNTLSDENERMRSTDVAAIVVDLDQKYTTSSVIASDPSMKGECFYSAPKPAGREDYCSVAYAATRLRDDNGKSVNGLKELMGAVPTTTDYYISWGEDGNPAQRSFRNLGRNRVHSSGAIAPNEPSFWTVDNLRSSDKYLVVKGYGANGYYEESLKCNFRIDIDGLIDVQDIRDGIVNYDTIITNWQYLNGCNYFTAADSVYWMKKIAKSNPNDYEWSVEKVINGSGVISVDNRYAMITNNNQSAVYLIGVVGDYDVNVEEGTAEKGSNVAKIYTITADRTGSEELKCTLHGPLDLKFAKGDTLNCFTAAYNPDECDASGLTIAYSTPSEGGSACRIRMWNQNADKGLLVTDVKIPDYCVIQGQPAIELNVSVRNYGYGRENPVPYTIHDENGEWLMQVINGEDVGETFYTGEDLYTGDTRVDKIYVRLNPKWTVNKEHQIIVEVLDNYKYNGNLDDVVNSVKTQADNTSLTAENTLIGGKHYISTTIENNTFVGEKTPIIKIEFDYETPRRGPSELKFGLPTKEMIYRFDVEDEELTDQIYHFDIDMDSIWESGLDAGLRGVYVSLVDEDGVKQSNEVLYLENPAERRTDAVTGKVTDENGDPLQGAVFGIFAQGSEEPAETAETDEDGVFSFNIGAPGEYIIKEIAAPDGYITDENAYPFTASGEGEILNVEIINRREEPETPVNPDAPDTSDNDVTLWIFLLVSAACAASLTVVKRTKRAHK